MGLALYLESRWNNLVSKIQFNTEELEEKEEHNKQYQEDLKNCLCNNCEHHHTEKPITSGGYLGKIGEHNHEHHKGGCGHSHGNFWKYAACFTTGTVIGAAAVNICAKPKEIYPFILTAEQYQQVSRISTNPEQYKKIFIMRNGTNYPYIMLPEESDFLDNLKKKYKKDPVKMQLLSTLEKIATEEYYKRAGIQVKESTHSH